MQVPAERGAYFSRPEKAKMNSLDRREWKGREREELTHSSESQQVASSQYRRVMESTTSP
jgi:hypothetical protein